MNSRVYSTALLVILLAGQAAAQTYEQQVAELVNIERWNNGQLLPLKFNPLLNAATETHSQNMATRNFFSGCDLDTKTVDTDRMEAAGYTGWSEHGENISAGPGTPADVMNAWMNGIGTKDNILSTDYREFGVGYVPDPLDSANVRFDDGTCNGQATLWGPFNHYWTQNFGTIDDNYPLVIEREAYQTSTRAVDLYVYGTGWALFMRFRNENSPWSPWQLYTEDKAWFTSQGDGPKTVFVQLQGPGGEIRTAQDDIVLSGSVIGIPGDGSPSMVTLAAPQPNPARGSTRISFQMRARGPVRLAVYDVSGRRTALLADEIRARGKHDITWDGRDDDGRRLPAGLYFVRLDAVGITRTTKLLLTP